MKSLATDPRGKANRVQVIKLLRAFGKPTKTVIGPDMAELSSSAGLKEQQQDYGTYIKLLHASLSSHCLCHRQDRPKNITANLRLKSCCTPGEVDHSVKFSLFFLDHPHELGGEDACQWQEAQICVSRKR